MSKFLLYFILSCLAFFSCEPAPPTQNETAPADTTGETGKVASYPPAYSPPMGWRGPVNSENIMEPAEWLAGPLKAAGYDYLIFDHSWYTRSDAEEKPAALDFSLNEQGLPLPPPGLDIKALADALHQKGLKFGLELINGIPVTAFEAGIPIKGSSFTVRDVVKEEAEGHLYPGVLAIDGQSPAAGEYYSALFAQLADWGVDYVVLDQGKAAFQPAQGEAIQAAIRRSGGAILVEWAMKTDQLPPYEQLSAQANVWPIASSTPDHWKALNERFALTRNAAKYLRPGSYPYAGPLSFPGHLSPNEQRTALSLWSIARSPLMLTGDPASYPAEILKLLTNKGLITVNQHSRNNTELYVSPFSVAWIADNDSSNDIYLAFFNTSEEPQSVHLDWGIIGWSGKHPVRDLWTQKELGLFDGSFAVVLPPHGAGLYWVGFVEME